MFVSGKIRGNAPQLANYLLTIGENERIVILDVDGRPHADAKYLKDTLHSMELNSELTRSNNSVYHAIIRPDPDSQSDRAMTMEEWHRATELLAQELPFKDQRRATVLHEKDGYYHAHVVFERYNHDRGTMVDYKHNYKAHDVARFQMEKEFGHNKTPQKNPDRANHKKTLTQIWKETNTGKEFIKQARENGYQIAKGTDRPFRVVDSNGISFDLVRQLDGVKTKEVRERLSKETLIDDKEAIRAMATLKHAKENIARPQEIVLETIIPSDNEDFKQHPFVSPADEQERQWQEFKKEMEATKERNRILEKLRNYTISALLVLHVCAPFKGQASSLNNLQQFSNNKETIGRVSNLNQIITIADVEQISTPIYITHSITYAMNWKYVLSGQRPKTVPEIEAKREGAIYTIKLEHTKAQEIHKLHDAEIDDTLEEMYCADKIETEFISNADDIVIEDESQQFIREMQQAKERNLSLAVSLECNR